MISDMHATNDGLFVVRSNSNQEMEGGFLDVNNGQFNILHTQRLALRQYPLSKEKLFWLAVFTVTNREVMVTCSIPIQK